MRFTEMLSLAAGGILGVFSRYGLGLWLNPPMTEGKFPYGTFLVNMLGCALIGVFLALRERYTLGPEFYLFFITGLLGAFTTFSGFSAEVLLMSKNNQWLNVVIYVGASNILGIILAALFYKWITP